jgi:hypothetical protein
MHTGLRAAVLGALALSSTSAFAQCETVSSTALFFAPYDVVFDVVTDAASYPDWNPYIVDVDPIDVDLRTVGSEFELTVLQPIAQVETTAAEIVTDVREPSFFWARLVYDFNAPEAPALGFPSRNQDMFGIFDFATIYTTSETFCGPLLPFLPLDDVQAGFDLQTEALGVEARRRARAH